jgi:hypothetical protein
LPCLLLEGATISVFRRRKPTCSTCSCESTAVSVFYACSCESTAVSVFYVCSCEKHRRFCVLSPQSALQCLLLQKHLRFCFLSPQTDLQHLFLRKHCHFCLLLPPSDLQYCEGTAVSVFCRHKPTGIGTLFIQGPSF